MPLIINSAPDCITHNDVASTKDLADFVLQNNYQDCAGFGTFMPGSTYGDGGSGAESLYMILTWVGIATFLPLGFPSGWLASWIMKKLNILRVPPEVELMGLDVAEYDPLIYLPEVASPGEVIVEPDGTIVPAEPVLRAARDEVVV